MLYRSLPKRVGNAVRLAEVIQVLVKHGFADLVQRMSLYEGLPSRVLRGLRILEHPSGPPETIGMRLRAALTELGPTFVKFGQILSTRPDLIGAKTCQDLSALQDNVDTLPFTEMRAILEEDLDSTIAECFMEFNEEAVAAASLSQVYRARTRTNREVAVKIQRPGVHRIIASDVSLLKGLADWVTEYVAEFEWMDLPGMIEEFERSIFRELDFTIEARVIQRFRKNYSGDNTVFVPRVEPSLSGRRVITMDWIDGARIDAVDSYAERNCTRREVAVNGCNALCRQVFEHHLFHADPHPGNILIVRDNRVAFLDYGMVGHLEPADVYTMADLLRAVFDENTSKCVEALLAFTSSGETEDVGTLEHEVAEFIAFEAQTVLGKADVGRALERITQILRRHKLQLAPRFSLLLKAMATIESTARFLDPGMDIAPIMRPYVEKIVMNRYSPQQLAHEGQEGLSAFMRIGRQLPGEVQGLLRQVRRGKLKVQLDHEGLDHLAQVTDRASNRIAFSMIAGSLIVGSSLMLSTNMGLHSLGLAGFLFAGAVGVALLISILRSKNY